MGWKRKQNKWLDLYTMRESWEGRGRRERLRRRGRDYRKMGKRGKRWNTWQNRRVCEYSFSSDSSGGIWIEHSINQRVKFIRIACNTRWTDDGIVFLSIRESVCAQPIDRASQRPYIHTIRISLIRETLWWEKLWRA